MFVTLPQALRIVSVAEIVVVILLLFHGLTHAVFSKNSNNAIAQESVTTSSFFVGIFGGFYALWCFKQYDHFDKTQLHIVSIGINFVLIFISSLLVFTSLIRAISINSAVMRENLLAVENDYMCCGWKEPRDYCAKKMIPTCYNVLIFPLNAFQWITITLVFFQVAHLVMLSVSLCVLYKPKKKEPDFNSIYTAID